MSYSNTDFLIAKQLEMKEEVSFKMGYVQDTVHFKQQNCPLLDLAGSNKYFLIAKQLEMKEEVSFKMGYVQGIGYRTFQTIELSFIGSGTSFSARVHR